MIVDHVTLVVDDDAATAHHFREAYGLGSRGGAYLDHLGATSTAVPLTPPQSVEWLAVSDPAVAEGSPTGRMLLDALADGGGLVAWTVLVDDIDAVAARTGIAPYAGATRNTYTGTFRRWWTVTGAPHLPIFIAYDGPPHERVERWQAAYDMVGHTCAPGGFARIEVGGDAAELDDWLGPHDLPVAVVDGPPGLRAVHVATANGPVVLR
ncbi:MAG TPA: VOC family protein [Frankiaceae bacterium]|nr:VOC family protein [Frankiaceae bacterium]